MDYFLTYRKFIDLLIYPLNSEKKQLLNAYFRLLTEEALVKGFIGKADPQLLWLRHILDALLVLQSQAVSEAILAAGQIIDLGSGAGIPGIPLAIMFPEKNFLLIESMKKRADFLYKVIERLGLKNAGVLNIRIEDIDKDSSALKRPQQNGPDGKSGKNTASPLVLFRAFLKPLVSLELSLYLVGLNSKLLYWRSRRFDTPLSQSGTLPENDFQPVNRRMKDMGYHVENFFELKCPEELAVRGVYLINYTGRKNKKYPRSWKQISGDVLNNKVI